MTLHDLADSLPIWRTPVVAALSYFLITMLELAWVSSHD